MKPSLSFCVLLLGVCLGLLPFPAQAYDPLATPKAAGVTAADLTVKDEKRDREIPLRVYLPADKAPAPVVLFSHGLGGSRMGSVFLGEHWAACGYVAVFVQHPGSDEAVWKEAALLQKFSALKDAANLQNYVARLEDVPAVLNQLEQWNQAAGHPLSVRMDLARVGMSGHSFGAITTQAVSGQWLPLTANKFTDPRIKSAVIMSPSAPPLGGKKAFADVKIPWLLMTGTKDLASIGNATMESRLTVFPALPPGGKYELVLDGAEHSVFTDRALPGESGKRNPNHHKVILALSTAFWDATLRGDAEAKAWLDGDEAKAVLEKADRWQKK